ncbi:MAG: YeeE/YedE family protein [Lentisphaerae bacterium]|nr:YeeE/YedE family protein [Lentisphaerota bacterium]
MECLSGAWPWYISGPLLGLMVPALLFFGNKQFGISSSFRHICAATLPLKADYFKHDWKQERWSISLVLGVVVGAGLAALFLDGTQAPELTIKARAMFVQWGLTDLSGLQPPEIFAVEHLGSLRNLVLLGAGGFLVGFGTRYANGCTSGHAIMGLSLLNVGSLVATVGFFIGGLAVSHFVLPWLMTL